MRDLLLHNFWWKLLSLLLAALTWLTIETTFKRDENLRESPVITESRRSMTIPIRLLTAGANTNDFRLFPIAVEVEISGAQARLEKLQSRDVNAYVDLTDVTTERQMQREIQVRVPRELHVESELPTAANIERITPAK